MLAEGLIEQPRGSCLLASGELHFDPAIAKDPWPATGGLLAGVLGGDHDPRDPRCQDRLCAGWLAALVSTGLKRHIHRGPGRVLPASTAVLQRGPLGMQVSQLGVPTLAD